MNASKIKTVVLNVLLALLIIFAPSNLFLVVCDGCGYVNGLQSDYLLPKLYLVDLLLVAIVGWGAWQQYFTLKKSWSKSELLIFGLVVALALRQLWAPFPLAAIWNFGQWALLVSCCYVLLQASRKKIISSTSIVTGLTLALLLQVGVSSYQYINQQPLFAYAFLGETDIRQVVGIATFDIGMRGEIRLSPYGTTAHPNILAGFIAVYSFLLAKLLVEQKNNRALALIASLAVGSSWIILALTQSFSGAAMLASGGLILALEQGKWLHQKSLKWWRARLAFLVVSIFLSGLVTTWLPTNEKLRFSSVNRRQYLLETSWNMIADNWLWGSGLSNFTATAESYSLTSEIVRFNQPVHHVGWLWVAETGMIGSVWLALLIANTQDKHTLKILACGLFLFLPILVWDHYLLSLENGRALSVTALALASTFFIKNNET